MIRKFQIFKQTNLEKKFKGFEDEWMKEFLAINKYKTDLFELYFIHLILSIIPSLYLNQNQLLFRFLILIIN